MQALIYAAGYGIRLRPITENLPKALVPFRGVPLLDWVIRNLITQGVDEIVINTHYLAKKIEEFLREYSYNIPISTSYEAKILGTGGGLYQTKDCWKKDPILICNADTLCALDLSQFRVYFSQMGAVICLATNHVQSNSMLLIDEKGVLCGREKKGKRSVYRTPEGNLRKVGFCGFHLLNPEILDLPTRRVEFSIIDQYLLLIQQGVKIDTWDIGPVFWQDIGTPETLKKAEIEYSG